MEHYHRGNVVGWWWWLALISFSVGLIWLRRRQWRASSWSGFLQAKRSCRPGLLPLFRMNKELDIKTPKEIIRPRVSRGVYQTVEIGDKLTKKPGERDVIVG